ncbi:MAG TPA: NAD(P)H-dependent oxidoreductase [Thermosynechococcaceae cyanobacterium]
MCVHGRKALLGKVILPIAMGGTIAHPLAIDYALKPVLSELGAWHLLGGVYAVDKQITRQPMVRFNWMRKSSNG